MTGDMDRFVWVKWRLINYSKKNAKEIDCTDFVGKKIYLNNTIKWYIYQQYGFDTL
jgi:hypothetical protein